MKPGIYTDLSIDDYHANKLVLSSTGLKKAKKSSREFLHYIMFEQESKSCFDFGNALELGLMDKVNNTNLFAEEVAIMQTEQWVSAALKDKPLLKNPKNSKLYQDKRSEFEENSKGKYIIKDKGHESKEMMDWMISSVMRDEVTRKLLSGTEYQISIVWEDPETGVLCKTRPDVCRTKRQILVDIKTTLDASPSGFSKQAAKNDYPMQAIMQIEGATQSGLMENVDQYYWLAIEKSLVPNHGLYLFQDADREFLYDSYKYYLNRAAECLREVQKWDKDNWDLLNIKSYGEMSPSPHGIIDLEIPLWYQNSI